MGIKVLAPFGNLDMVQNTTHYSVTYSMRDLFYGITDQEFGWMAIADSTTASNSVTVTMEGSLDGFNWDTGVSILSTVDVGDGNADWGAINAGKPYGFVRFKAVEDNNGAIVDFCLYVSYPTSEVVR